jgi:NADH dehydrogenase FAD-containing subunit
MSEHEINKVYKLHHIVVLGGGFGGLYAAKILSEGKLKVAVIDKRNFHLFQPFIPSSRRLVIPRGYSLSAACSFK